MALSQSKANYYYSVYDIVLISLLTAMTIASKTIVGVLVRLITGPLGIPGGALAGGFYMMWLPLTLAILNKRGSALSLTFVQILVVLISGVPGSHGLWSFITYMLPACLVEIVFLFKKEKSSPHILHFVLATLFANLLGTMGSNVLFFRLALVPLLFTLVSAALSGILGGIVGYFTYKQVLLSLTCIPQLKRG